jgi:hypothetical protein
MSIRNVLTALACVFLLATIESRAQQDPNGLAYEPDAMFAASDGTILIVHKQERSVYRWSPGAGAYTQSIELQDEPAWFTYAGDTNRAYVAYDDGEVTVLDLANEREDRFIKMPRSVRGLAMAGSFLLIVDSSGRGETHYIFDQSGQFLSWLTRNDDSSEYVWNPHNRKMYYFDNRSRPRAFQWEDIDIFGVFGARMESSRDYRDVTVAPLRLSQDGSLALLGSGVIFDALTLEPVGSLPESIAEAYWRADGSVAAILDAGDQQLLQVYDLSDRLESSVSIQTSYARLVPVTMAQATTRILMTTTTECRTSMTRFRWIRQKRMIMTGTASVTMPTPMTITTVCRTPTTRSRWIPLRRWIPMTTASATMPIPMTTMTVCRIPATLFQPTRPKQQTPTLTVSATTPIRTTITTA